jgi:hypothetical protein
MYIITMGTCENPAHTYQNSSTHVSEILAHIRTTAHRHTYIVSCKPSPMIPVYGTVRRGLLCKICVAKFALQKSVHYIARSDIFFLLVQHQSMAHTWEIGASFFSHHASQKQINDTQGTYLMTHFDIPNDTQRTYLKTCRGHKWWHTEDNMNVVLCPPCTENFSFILWFSR